MARFALDGQPHAVALRQVLFRFIPERLVVRVRSAPPRGAACDDAYA